MTERPRVTAATGSTSVRWTAPVAVLAALAAALGFALAAAPNIELITLTVFISGTVLGRLRGALVGLIGMGVYSGLGPYGSGLAIPTMFAGQLGSMALVGLAGGLMGGVWRGDAAPEVGASPGRGAGVRADDRAGVRVRSGVVVLAALAGFSLTCIYQVAVISGYAVASPEFESGFIAALTANLFFPYVHIIWNTVLFAVLVPVVVPRVRRLAVRGTQGILPTLMAALVVTGTVLLLAPLPAQAQEPTPPAALTQDELIPPGLEPDAEPVPAAAEVALPGSLGFELWDHPLAVRSVIGLGQGEDHDASVAFDALPALRRVSSGWPGQRASVTRGGLPAGLSVVSMGGRPAGGWLFDGLGLWDAVATDGGVLVPSGIDLSTWSLFGAGVVSAAPGGFATPAGSGAAVVGYHAGRRYAGTPFSRVGMASGDDGLRWRVLEFGSGLDGRGGVTGFFEGRDGRGPGTGGEYARDSFGASASLELAGDWRAELSGSSVTASRSIPDERGVSGAVLDLSSGSADLTLTHGSTRLGIFHAATRVGDLRAGDSASCRSERTGVTLDLPVGFGPLRSVRAHASGLSADGDLLTSGGVHALSTGASITAGARLGGWKALITAGASREREQTVPEVTCLMTRDGRAAGPWLSVDVGGRFPTALELAGADRPIVGDENRLLGGSRDLKAEQAATVALGWALGSGRLDAGISGEVSRVLSPVVLEEDGAGVHRPASGEDATASMLALWAAAVDTALGGLRVAAEVIGIDEDGPLNALAPVPELAADVSVWVDRRFFKQTLDVRFELSVACETGLARGAWESDIEDALWRSRIRIEGSVGPAHLLIAVDDPLDTDSGGWPGYTLSEPRVTYAFTWDFWN